MSDRTAFLVAVWVGVALSFLGYGAGRWDGHRLAAGNAEGQWESPVESECIVAKMANNQSGPVAALEWFKIGDCGAIRAEFPNATWNRSQGIEGESK